MGLVYVFGDKSNGTEKRTDMVLDKAGRLVPKVKTVRKVSSYSRQFPAGEATFTPGRLGIAAAVALELVQNGYENVRIVNLATGETVKVNGNDVRKHKVTLQTNAVRREKAVAEYTAEMKTAKNVRRMADSVPEYQKAA